MTQRGSINHFCGCRGSDGKRLGSRCPLLRTPRHGSYRYVVDVGTEGKRKQQYGNAHGRKSDAQRELEDVRRRLADGVVADRHETTGEWLEQWYSTKSGTLRPTTLRDYRSHLDLYLIPALGDVPLEELRPREIRRMLADIEAANDGRRRPVGAASRRKTVAVLRSALQAAVNERRLDFNAARFVELPKATRAVSVPWGAEQLGQFLDSAGADALAPVLETMAFTGLRRGEALGLRWSDVDLQEGFLTVRQQLIESAGHLAFGVPKTRSGENRKVGLADVTVGLLLGHQIRQAGERAAWGDAYNDSGLVFCRANGSPLRPSSVLRRFRELADEAGLPRMRLHDLRHLAASLQIAAGVPLPLVSKSLGHSQYTFTVDTYGHLTQDVQRRAAEQAAALVRRQPRGNVVSTEPTSGARQPSGRL